MIVKELERTLDIAMQEAKARHHEYVCSEHILYALLQEKDVTGAIINCGGDVDRLRKDLEEFFQTYPGALPEVWPKWHCPSHGTALEDEGGVLVCSNAHIFPVAMGFLDSSQILAIPPRLGRNGKSTG